MAPRGEQPKENRDANRKNFPLDSDTCELLLAFADGRSLEELAAERQIDVKNLLKRPNIRGLAPLGTLIEKIGGEWVLTPLGLMLAKWTREAIASQRRLLRQQEQLRLSSNELNPFGGTGALVLIGVQKGFEDPAWGQRNNPDAIQRIQVLLNCWRERGLPVYHVKHVSERASSPLAVGTRGIEFLDFVHPREDEIVIEKSANSAFVGTELEKTLRRRKHSTMVLVGFPLNQCVDATARMAGDLGFTTFVVSDATSCFDRVGIDGRRLDASMIYRSTLANLNQEFAVVVDSATVIDKLADAMARG